MSNKICVYAICKNEEQFVDKWVKSMSEADSIVVLDTGSTDNTVQKLKDLGVTVEVKEIKPWRFDVARNEAMKLVPEDCNILVSTDLDELLEPGWGDVLRSKWIDGVHERAEYKYTWSHLSDGSEGRSFMYNKIHSKNWIWKAPVHELLGRIDQLPEKYTLDEVLNMPFDQLLDLSHGMTENYKYEEKLYLFDEIHLHHYPDSTKSRGCYLPLLEIRAKENPEDYYGLIYLAHEYCYRGFYDKSIDLFRKILTDYAEHYNSIEQASCYVFIGDCYKSKAENEDPEKKDENYQKAILGYQKGIAIEPTYREPYFNLAKVYLAINDYKAADFYIKRGIEKSFRHYTWLERDSSWAYEPYDLLCLSAFYSGRKRDALAYAYKALSMDKNNERLKSNLELCLENTNDIELII